MFFHKLARIGPNSQSAGINSAVEVAFLEAKKPTVADLISIGLDELCKELSAHYSPVCPAVFPQPTRIPLLLVTDHDSGRQIGCAVTEIKFSGFLSNQIFVGYLLTAVFYFGFEHQ